MTLLSQPKMTMCENARHFPRTHVAKDAYNDYLRGHKYYFIIYVMRGNVLMPCCMPFKIIAESASMD